MCILYYLFIIIIIIKQFTILYCNLLAMKLSNYDFTYLPEIIKLYYEVGENNRDCDSVLSDMSFEYHNSSQLNFSTVLDKCKMIELMVRWPCNLIDVYIFINILFIIKQSQKASFLERFILILELDAQKHKYRFELKGKYYEYISLLIEINDDIQMIDYFYKTVLESLDIAGGSVYILLIIYYLDIVNFLQAHFSPYFLLDNAYFDILYEPNIHWNRELRSKYFLKLCSIYFYPPVDDGFNKVLKEITSFLTFSKKEDN